MGEEMTTVDNNSEGGPMVPKVASKDKDFLYFMGRVDQQLDTVLAVLSEQNVRLERTQGKIDTLTEQLMTMSSNWNTLEGRVKHLEDELAKIPDPENLVTHGWIREKLIFPLILAGLAFLLYTLVPNLLKHLGSAGP